jgi:GTP:adenosylcobinamide-phosphate guanylyltransferase
MKGVIMAGGFGTRLKPLTINRPKPMVPVANRPIMEHIVTLLRRHGITDLVSILYFQPEHITSHFGDGSAFGVNMQYVTADADYGTAGAVRNAADLLGEDRVIVISGDVLTDFDLGAAIRSHEERAAEATIALTGVENPLAFGIVILDEAVRPHRAVPGEADLGRGLQRHHQHRDLHPGARGAAACAASHQLRLLQGPVPADAAGGGGAVRPYRRGLLAGHRQHRRVPHRPSRRAHGRVGIEFAGERRDLDGRHALAA